MRRHDGMPQMAFNRKSSNEVELKKLSKRMRDTGEVSQAPKTFRTICQPTQMDSSMISTLLFVEIELG